MIDEIDLQAMAESNALKKSTEYRIKKTHKRPRKYYKSRVNNITAVDECEFARMLRRISFPV
jgi:hypothetical protein